MELRTQCLYPRVTSSSCPNSIRHECFLVGGIPTPLKNMQVSWDDYSQYMEKKKYSKPQTRIYFSRMKSLFFPQGAVNIYHQPRYQALHVFLISKPPNGSQSLALALFSSRPYPAVAIHVFLDRGHQPIVRPARMWEVVTWRVLVMEIEGCPSDSSNHRTPE